MRKRKQPRRLGDLMEEMGLTAEETRHNELRKILTDDYGERTDTLPVGLR